MRLSAALAALLVAARLAAAATPLEDAYIAARDKYLKHFEQIDPVTSEAAAKEEKLAIADLEGRLKTIVGPVAVKGTDGAPRSIVDTLTSGDDTFGHLDGLAYGPIGNKQMTVVTTEGLLKNWLKLHESWWGDKEPKMPQTPRAALKTEGFYTQAIADGAAFMFYAELPIAKPAAADFAVAYLYVTAQEIGPWQPNQILVSVIRNGKLFIATQPVKTPIPKIAACEAIWKAAEKRDADTQAASGAEDVRDKADKEFHRCFAERARAAAFFPKLIAEAQAIVGGLPAN